MADLSQSVGGRIKQMLLLTGLLAVGGVLTFFAVTSWLKIPCLFHLITDLQCPGCGNTRATIALCHLNFKQMLAYNLLFPLELLYLLWVYGYCAVNYIRNARFAYRSRPSVLDVTVLIALAVWTVVRNLPSLF